MNQVERRRLLRLLRHARHARHMHEHVHKPRALRRQLFMGFGLAILLTTLTSGIVSILFWPLHGHHHPPWLRPLPLFVAASVLWALSGALAHRLALPLLELMRAVKDFGAGKLDRRARVPHRSPYEVAELAGAFNDMATRIEALVQGQRELIGAVSHELRTPLARLRVLLGILQESSGDAALIAKFEREIVEMDALVGELLAQARIASGALTVRALDLADIVRECAERLGISVARVEVCSDVRGDPTLISRALTLLLDNAKKHGGEQIEVIAVRQGNVVRIAVEDDGPGFEPADLPRLFEPFTRGRGAPPDEKRGVGLGMYLVRRIAEAHAGAVFAENRPQGGARVGFTLGS